MRPSLPAASAFAIVLRMPDEYMDPSGNTSQFRAFVSEPEPAPEPSRRIAILVAGGVLAALALALAVWALS